ncbi:MAG: hypothetical protein HYW50_01315 [Candidatus Diapherotrites archaeon]|nr:hypothetical protein [Candidatus Diapherotrites archaeon]
MCKLLGFSMSWLFEGTFLALAGELYWFLKIASKNKFKGLGTKIGFFIILLYLVIGYLVFVAPALQKKSQNYFFFFPDFIVWFISFFDFQKK